MNKKLYFLHIPKTGGMSVATNIKNQLENNNIKSFIFYDKDYSENIIDYDYIQGHIGLYPNYKIKNLDTISILRDPVERSVSNFMHIFHTVVLNRGLVYDKILKIEDKLKYYLFEDIHYKDHYNLQTQFLCLKGDKNYVNEKKPEVWQHVYKRSHRWNLEHGDISEDLAKKTIDSMSLCATIEEHELISRYIENWFKNNFNVKIILNEEDKVNESKIRYLNYEYTTKDLLSLLSNDDRIRIINNNIIDYNIFNYVKNKEKK